MSLSRFLAWFQWNPPPSSADESEEARGPPFAAEKRLCERDYLIVDMLNSQGHERVSYCVTDPHLEDNPVIYISAGFSRLTGYAFADIVGKNCRFLQGPKTSEEDRARIRDAIRNEEDCSVNLLNHKKDGSVFVNEFFLTTLRTPEKEIAYYIGIQVAVAEKGPGQMPSNPGWVYALGSHA